jgi:hypothetical protein
MPYTRRTIPKVLYQALRDSLRVYDKYDYLAERVDLKKIISANSENGQVVILESGMDCDCVAFSNRKYKVDALLIAVRTKMDRIYGDAEGPCHLSIVSPSEAKALQYGSRDLGMEAYENGHPSRVSYHPGIV